MIKLMLAFLSSFALSCVLMPFVIKLFKRVNAGQTILKYVENHQSKNGTPTMGGVVFIISTLILSFVFLKFNTIWFTTLLFSLFFGILGLMDDYLKIKYKQNLGLRPYQKIIGQFGLSLIFALFVYFFTLQKGQIFIPFTFDTFNASFFAVPLIIIVLIATTNSVNLTDGIDGLAGSVTLTYLINFTIITSIVHINLFSAGETGEILLNIENINTLSMLFAGSILAFLLFNTNKASIFMGDAGSLCLGGYIGASACLLGFELIIPILGLCFVLSALSVILQVAVFKIKKKRIFKMAPYHHHLQLSNVSEPKIVIIYSTITAIVGIISIIFYLL